MPHINDMKESKYLKKEDIGKAALVTITGCIRKNIAKPGETPDFKWMLTFSEFEKPLIVNPTNRQLTARACGSEMSEDWIGKQIVLYLDPNVSFAGNLTGGIRIRAPKVQAAAQPAQSQVASIKAAAAKWTKGHAMPAAEPEPVEEMLEDSEIPF